MDEIADRIISGIIGGSVVAATAWGGLLWHLRKVFFTRDEANGLGERLNQIEREGTSLAQRDHEHLVRLESEIRRDLINPIQQMTRAIQEMREWRAGEEQDRRHQNRMLEEVRDFIFGEGRPEKR